VTPSTGANPGGGPTFEFVLPSPMGATAGYSPSPRTPSVSSPLPLAPERGAGPSTTVTPFPSMTPFATDPRPTPLVTAPSHPPGRHASPPSHSPRVSAASPASLPAGGTPPPLAAPGALLPQGALLWHARVLWGYTHLCTQWGAVRLRWWGWPRGVFAYGQREQEQQEQPQPQRRGQAQPRQQQQQPQQQQPGEWEQEWDVEELEMLLEYYFVDIEYALNKLSTVTAPIILCIPSEYLLRGY